MCTDGLYGYVNEENIRKILKRHKNLDSCVGQLIDAANAAGGQDNITAILIHCAMEKNKESV